LRRKACELIEQGFDYVTDMDNVKIFRKCSNPAFPPQFFLNYEQGICMIQRKKEGVCVFYE